MSTDNIQLLGVTDHEIPDNSNYPPPATPSWKPWIQHRVLTMMWGAGGPGVKPGVRLRVHDPRQDTNARLIDHFIANHSPCSVAVLNVPSRCRHPMDDEVEAKLMQPTPWDIDLCPLDGAPPRPNPPRWLVIELDDRFDWAFSEGGHGIRRKKLDPRAEDYNLRFINQSGPPTKTPGPGCRMAYWWIQTRPIYTEIGFNFYITVNDPEVSKGTPMIFDPNVPDSGGASIP